MSKQKQKLKNWSTSDEIQFLETLGRHSKSNAVRQDLLENYIRAAKERNEWGRVDKDAILYEARQMMETRKP